jgi:hypothetical protein
MAMPQIVIRIDCSNDAFRSRAGKFKPEPEIAYILSRFAEKITFYANMPVGSTVRLRDTRGRDVGVAKMTWGCMRLDDG